MALRRRDGKLLRTPSGALASSDNCCCYEYVTLTDCDDDSIAYAVAPLSASTIGSGGSCYSVGSSVTLTPSEATPLITPHQYYDDCEECEGVTPTLICFSIWESINDCEGNWGEPVMTVSGCGPCTPTSWTFDRCQDNQPIYRKQVCGGTCSVDGDCAASAAPEKPTLTPDTSCCEDVCVYHWRKEWSCSVEAWLTIELVESGCNLAIPTGKGGWHYVSCTDGKVVYENYTREDSIPCDGSTDCGSEGFTEPPLAGEPAEAADCCGCGDCNHVGGDTISYTDKGCSSFSGRWHEYTATGLTLNEDECWFEGSVSAVDSDNVFGPEWCYVPYDNPPFGTEYDTRLVRVKYSDANGWEYKVANSSDVFPGGAWGTLFEVQADADCDGGNATYEFDDPPNEYLFSTRTVTLTVSDGGGA